MSKAVRLKNIFLILLSVVLLASLTAAIAASSIRGVSAADGDIRSYSWTDIGEGAWSDGADAEPFTEQTVEHDGAFWKVNGEYGNEWTLGDNNTASLVSARSEENDNTARILATYALRPSPLGDIVGVSMRMKVTIQQDFTVNGNNKIGFYPFYQDANNYLFVNLSQWGDRPLANFSVVGVLNGQNVGGGNNFIEEDTESVTNTNIRTAGSFWFGADFYADKVDLRIGTSAEELNTVKHTYTFANALNVSALTRGAATYIGFGGNSAAASFTDVTVDPVDTQDAYSEQVRGTGSLTWKVNGASNGAEWTVNEDGTAVLQAAFVQDQNDGFDRLVDKTYAVRPTMAESAFGVRYTATMTVEEAYTENGCTKFGVIPFFLDQNNYVLVKLSQWQDQPNAVINLSGRINGKDLVNDARQPWFESSATSLNIRTPGTQITLAVVVYADKVDVYAGDAQEPFTYTYRTANGDTVEPAVYAEQSDLTRVYVGFAGNQKKVSFSALQAGPADGEEPDEPVTPAEPFTEQTVSHGGADWKVNGEFGTEWTLGDNNTADLAVSHNEAGSPNNEIILGTYALRPTFLDVIVGVHMSMKIEIAADFTVDGNNKIGFYPFYQDANNYLFVNLSQWGDRPYANFSVIGMLNGNPVGGSNNFIENNTESVTNTNIRTAGSFWFGADFYADRVEFYIGTAEDTLAKTSVTYTFAQPLDTAVLRGDAVTYVGFGGNAASAKFSGLVLEAITEPSVPAYTEQDRTAGDVVWKVNGAHNGEEWTIGDDGSAVLKADFVQDQGNGTDRLIDKTYAVRPTMAESAFGVRYTATMTVEEAYTENGCTKFGVIPFFLDQNNYVLVKLSQWQDQAAAVINVTGRIGGRDLVNAGGSPWFEGSATGINIRAAGTVVKLSVSVFADQIYVFIGDAQAPALTYEYLVRGENGAIGLASFEEQTDLTKVYVGFAGNQKNLTFSALTFTEDEARSDEIGGGWTTNNPFGWTVDTETGMLQGTATSESNAYQATELRGGWVVEATITMSKSGVAEGTQGVLYKAGLTPFYKDAYNYISVWIQQYGNDAGARLVAKGLINGQPLVNANGAGFWEGEWFDTFTPVTESTTFVMRCEVTERAVNVYIDGEYAASLRTQTGIPFGENEAALSYGAILENGTAEFTDFTLEGSSAILTETEITITVITTGGTPVTDATVMNGGQAFVNNGDGTYTLTVPVRSGVTITVEKEGYDSVTYEVETSAMYQPEVKRTIEIAEEEVFDIPEFNDEDPAAFNVGALIGGIAAGVVVIAAVVVAAVLVRKKKAHARTENGNGADTNKDDKAE